MGRVEIPRILEDHGLIDDLEAQHMQDLLQAGRDPEIALKGVCARSVFKILQDNQISELAPIPPGR
jgi:hypothetical protein